VTYVTTGHVSVSPDDIRKSVAVRTPQASEVANFNQLRMFTEDWLDNRNLSDHTRKAYRYDVNEGWLRHCEAIGLDPLKAMFYHVNSYRSLLQRTINPATGKPLSVASRARRLAAMSSWYSFLAKLIGIQNPVQGADREAPRRDHSTTVGLTATEVDSFLLAAKKECDHRRDGNFKPAMQLAGLRNNAMANLLADLGLRAAEALAIDLENLRTEEERRVVRFVGKGGFEHMRGIPSRTAYAIDEYLRYRAQLAGVPVDQLRGPLFVTESGQRWRYDRVYELVRRLAKKAGIPAWQHISPHSLRHAFATEARENGVMLQDVQEAMGHRDPRTTQRYERSRYKINNDPSYVLALARDRRGKVA
jgi:integrase/recombinase XerD